MNTDYPLTAEAVATDFGLHLDQHVRNQIDDDESSHLDGQTVRDIPFDQLESSVAQHERLIDNIRRNRVDGQLSDRDAGRLSEAEQSLSVFQAELDRRAQPLPRKTNAEVNGAPGTAAVAAAPRAGVVLKPGVSPSRQVFGLQNSQWKNSDEFFNAIISGARDTRLFNSTALEGNGADGGFAVPPQFYTGVMDGALQAAEFAPRCRHFQTATNTIVIPMPDTQNRYGGNVAGLLGNWTTEGTQQLRQKLTWRAETLKLNKVFIYSDATSELVEDGMNIAAQLTGAMSAAAAYSIDAAILNGSGVKQPLGLIGHPSVIKVAKDANQLPGTITYGNLVSMYSRIAPKCQKNGVWFCSSDVMPQLLSMVFPGSTNPILVAQMTAGGSDTPTQTIFGKRIVATEIASPLGQPGDIVFADMSEYAVAMKSSARIEQSNAPGFDADIQSWRLILRVTGQPLWSQPITPSGGGQTLSWATFLEKR